MDISTQDNINILVLGEFCCSTAGLCHQFTDNWWYDMGTYGPHYDTSWRKIFTVDGMPSLVDLDEVHDVWFLDHHSNFLARRAHAFILIYDVTSRKGFDFISRAHERVLEKSRNKPLSNASSGESLRGQQRWSRHLLPTQKETLRAPYKSSRPSFIEGRILFQHAYQSSRQPTLSLVSHVYPSSYNAQFFVFA